jgi:hypothetical protein
MQRSAIPASLALKAGELIEVRSKEEILSTLDRNGCVDGMPFMPEMFEYCGKQFRVFKRAHKTCDTINNSGGRSVKNAVHLEGVRCDGKAHGGCQAECLVFWKEAWLGRAITGPLRRHDDAALSESPFDVTDAGAVCCTESDVRANVCRRDDAPTNEAVYFCQATQLLSASAPLLPGDWGQYWEDYVSGNFPLKWMLGVISYATYNALISRCRPGSWIRRILYWIYNGFQMVRGKPRHPRTRGRIPAGAPTPTASLGLQPGEMVRVKSFEAILNTIDETYKNRGMIWDAEMVPYCGGVYRIRNRIRQIIDEKTGKMVQLKSEPVTLEGAVCQAKYSNCRFFCPRSIYPYWREIWLERVSEGPVAPQTDVDKPLYRSKA